MARRPATTSGTSHRAATQRFTATVTNSANQTVTWSSAPRRRRQHRLDTQLHYHGGRKLHIGGASGDAERSALVGSAHADLHGHRQSKRDLGAVRTRRALYIWA